MKILIVGCGIGGPGKVCDTFAVRAVSVPHRSEASLICQIHLWSRPSILGRGRIDEEKKGDISLPTDPNLSL